jgi:hypothetical protein
MSGTQEDSSRSLTILREDVSTGLASARSPVLRGLSETELDAIVSQLRTDKNLTLAPAAAAREHWGALTEQLLLSTPGVLGLHESELAREEAARQAWHIALGERVNGPLDISALRAHWERGELGPDSLCWRKGFAGWQRVCQVPGLAEFLAPRPASMPSSAEELVPDPRADALDFPLRGAEALRILAEDVPPPLPSKQPASLPPFLEPEPVTAPVLEPEPDTQPEAPQARDAAGAHPILPTQVEVRLRGGAWLALGGGIVGGMLVAFAVWLLGLSGALGLSPRGPSSQEATSADTAGTAASTASATAPKSTASGTPGTAVPPTRVATRPDAMALVPAIGADSTRALAPGVDATRAPASGSDSTRAPALGANPVHAPALGADSVRVPAIGAGSSLSGAASSLKPAPAPTPLPKPMPLETEALAAPQRATAPVRPVLPDPPMQKLAKAEVSTRTDPLAERRVASQTGLVEEEGDEDLGLDEEFERELNDPAKRATPPKRTVWVPPAPQMVEPPVSLSQSDIFSVVVSNKGDITSCVSAQKLQSEEGNRRVVVRWSILPSGKVTEVFTETANYQGTPLALCLEGKVRAWSFPKHREQGSPVRFPFVF